jgi:hypothetical protein
VVIVVLAAGRLPVADHRKPQREHRDQDAQAYANDDRPGRRVRSGVCRPARGSREPNGSGVRVLPHLNSTWAGLNAFGAA